MCGENLSLFMRCFAKLTRLLYDSNGIIIYKFNMCKIFFLFQLPAFILMFESNLSNFHCSGLAIAMCFERLILGFAMGTAVGKRGA